MDNQGFITSRVREFLYPPPRPEGQWGSPNLLIDGYRGLLPRG